VKTEVIAADSSRAIARAVELLERGEVVALPTETVYGLAADALQPEAVAKIFEAKERPRFDPLIVHLPDSSWLERVANVSTQKRSISDALTKKFWPGPLTLVLPKTELISEIVTAGLQTVAVRISAHPVVQDVISELEKPLAAPSANRFGRVSPTSAQHVVRELGDRIPLIVDGGSTEHGLESTVVSIEQDTIRILRPGPVTPDQLEAFGKVEIVTRPTTISSPGQLTTHYAPRTPVRLTDNATGVAPDSKKQVGLLAWNVVSEPGKFSAMRYLSEKKNLREAAVNLFRYLRELDEANVDVIVAELVPESGLGIAINDRLRRAAAGG